MIRDNLQPLTAFLAPPASLDEAIQRVAEMGSSMGLMGLTGAVFRDSNQLCKALAESGFHARPKVLMDSGRVKTIRIAIEGIAGTGSEGWEYDMFLTETSEQFARIDNCKLTKVAPGADPESVAALKELMR